MKHVILLFAFGCFLKGTTQTYNQNYGRVVTIQSSQVNSLVPLNDFPVLMHFSDPALKSVANGGNVASDSGDDIIFIETDCSTQLDHQIQKYDPATGEVVAWIKVNTLDNATDTDVYLLYGDSTAVNSETDQVWSNGYTNVYHLDAEVDTTDVTANGYDGTNYGTTNDPNAKVLGGRYFDSENDYIEVSTAGMSTTDGTVSAWVRPDDLAGFTNWEQYIFGHTTQPAWSDRIQLYFNQPSPSGSLNLGFGDAHLLNTGITTFADSAWKYVTLTWSKHQVMVAEVYVDGVLMSTDTVNNFNTFHPTADIGNNGEIATSTASHGQGFYGIIDEFQISNVGRKVNWISTCFNNQNDPGAFSVLGAQVTYADLCANGVLELQNQNLFNIYPVPAKDFFTIELKHPENGELTVSLTDVNGKIVQNELFNVTKDQMSVQVSVANLQAGVYVLKLNQNNKVEVSTFIVK